MEADSVALEKGKVFLLPDPFPEHNYALNLLFVPLQKCIYAVWLPLKVSLETEQGKR